MLLNTYALTGSQQRALERGLSDRAPGPWVVTHGLRGDLDLDRLRTAIDSLVELTALFQRSYVRSGRLWTMLESNDVDSSLIEFDMRGQPEDVALGILTALSTQSYRPEVPPLARFSLIRRDDGNLLVFTAASWLLDSFSLGSIFSALSQAYAGNVSAANIDINQLQAVHDEQAFLDSPAAASARRYWLALLRDRRTQVAPARWFDPSGQKSFNQIIDSRHLLPALEVAKELGLTLPQIFRNSIHLMLSRMTGNDSVVTSVMRRPGFSIKQALSADLPVGYQEVEGYHVSTPRPEMRVRDYFLDTMRLFEYTTMYSRLPGDDLQSLMRQIEPGFDGFTNVAARLDCLPYGVLELEGVEVQCLPELSSHLITSDITFSLLRSATPSITLAVRDSAVMASMRRWMDAFVYRMDHLVDDLDTEIGALEWMSAEQRSVMIDLALGKPASQPARSFLDRFIDQVEAHPDAEAVRDESSSLSYRELLAAADALAERLRPFIAGRVDPLVGICLPRGVGMIVAIIGIMRAGAGYVPLDPGNPPERLSFIIADSSVTAVIADDETELRLQSIESLSIIHLPSIDSWRSFLQKTPARTAISASQTAYVIYTSGTTGLPKGVVVERRNLAAFLAGTDVVCNTQVGHRWMQFASLNFDASVLEIANSLARGAALVVASSATRVDPEAVAALLRDERITHAFIPPAMLRSLPRLSFPELTDIYVGGEASDDLTVAYWSRAVRLWNVYGPTETTVLCSAHRIGDQRSASDLGGPLPGYAMHVLDEKMQPVPFGAVGEIWIGGEGVTRGYLGRSELTAQKFLDNPFGTGRLYRSGDLARHLPNGSIEYLGRNDFQVKIRGFRIELGDVEHAIAAVEGVTGVYVTVIDTPAGKALAAWFTAAGTDVTPALVSQAIAQSLPYYMVPSHLVRMEVFPVNISGKIDRTRLPMPGSDDSSTHALLSFKEQQVRDIWAEILGVEANSLGPDSHFFHLGGHSLTAALTCHAIAQKLGISVSPRLLFEHPKLADFCDSAGAAAGGQVLDPVLASGATTAKMPGAMPAMMYRRLAQYGEDTAYTIVMGVDVDSSINPHLLHRALTDLFAADPVFRSFMTECSGSVRFHVAADVRISVPILQDVKPCEIAEDFRSLAFDLGTPPLWRAALVLGESGPSILFAVHHAIFDGWSLNVLLEELAARYDALLADRHYERLSPSMIDYAAWLDGHADVRRRSIRYWQEKLSSAKCRTQLPTATGLSRPFSNRFEEIQFSPQSADSLRAWSSANDVTLPPVLFAAYLIWLWRITGQRELIVAYPYAGRDVPGSEHIYGMLVQMGFLRLTIDPEESLSDLVSRVARQMLDDREHLVVSAYDADLSVCGAPNILFSLQSGIGLDAAYGSLVFSAHEYASTSSKADIAAILYDSADGGLSGRVEYDASALDPDAIPHLIESLTTVINSLAANPNQSVSFLPYLPDAQRIALEAFSGGDALPRGSATLVDAWRSAVAVHPDHVAIVDATRQWTYRQVEELTDRMAHHMLDAGGVAPNQLIGLSGSKSPELIFGALSILKCGAAYVPLDPTYPLDRLAYILEDAQVRCVVADEQGIRALCQTGVSELQFIDPYKQYSTTASDLPRVDRRQLAYVIYTSGSTGRPKGVLIEHGTVPPMLRAVAQRLEFDAQSRMLLLGTLNFDASVLQMFMALTSGATLVVPPSDAERDLEKLHDFIADQGVTHMLATPALIRNLPRRDLPALRVMGFGGESIDAGSAQYWSQATALYSLYGPTETTVACTGGRILSGGNFRTIGKPLSGYSIQLVNELLQPVPLGAIGEILIGGGAARGYLGMQDLTLQRFIPEPTGAHPYTSCYRSGDLGRFLPDGSIEFLGRNDDQIKLRGFRIELGEIETALQQLPGVSAAAVAVHGEGDLRRLVGYVVANGDFDHEVMRELLSERLPSYMVPSMIVSIDALPTNANGKLDRKALPDVTYVSASDLPHDGTEKQIAGIWEELLRIQGVGRADDFFKIGGNSLLAARLQTLLRERLGIDVNSSTLYAAPTIAAIAGHSGGDVSADALLAAREGIIVADPVAPRVECVGPPHALLTGASGFLGIYLLRDLLGRCAKVSCLMRGSDKAMAQAILVEKARSAGLKIDFERVSIVLGDLAAENLGLHDHVFKMLADEIDLIVHNGAWVHHLYSYTTLRASNVDATANLIRMALNGARRASFCFVSTESVAAEIAGIAQASEQVLDPIAHPSVAGTGYVLGKWVSEQLVASAVRNYQLDAVIARPGNITGDSSSGYSNYLHNHFWLLTKSCLQLAMAPDLPGGVEMTPVDVLSRAIVELTLHRQQGLCVANLGNTVAATWREFLSDVSSILGRTLAPVSVPVWQQALAAADASNALASLRGLYEGDLEHSAPMEIRHEQTQALLARLGASTAVDQRALTSLYVRYLEQEGFWPL